MNIRTATTADTAKIADFYARLDHPEQAPWIEIMMGGRHPYTRADNLILVEDREIRRFGFRLSSASRLRDIRCQ